MIILYTRLSRPSCNVVLFAISVQRFNFTHVDQASLFTLCAFIIGVLVVFICFISVQQWFNILHTYIRHICLLFVSVVVQCQYDSLCYGGDQVLAID